MPDKTLKEKVDAAREALKWIADRPESHKRFTEALTALEERVEELEKQTVCSCGSIMWVCSVCTEARSFVEVADGE